MFVGDYRGVNEKLKKFILVVLILSCVLMSSCGVKRENKRFATDKLKVCTSFCTMYDFVEKIGKDKVEVINIVPYGVEPHDWEPNPQSLVLLEEADLLVCNGKGMEGWLDKIEKTINNKDITIIEASNGVDAIDGDPHVWLNPQNAKIEMMNITKALIELDRENKEYYEANYAKYSKEIDKLDEEYFARLSGCTKKEVVVSHGAFGYLCNRYGLEQIALQGVGSEGEPTLKRISEVIRLINDRDIKVVFGESASDEKIMKTISKEAKISVGKLNTLENMSEEGIKKGEEYFKIMRDNLDGLVLALS